MFNTEDLKCLDPKYFNIIAVDDYDVTIISRNTGHYWYLHNPEYPGEGTVIIFHKHKASHPYHQHGRASLYLHSQFLRHLFVMVMQRDLMMRLMLILISSMLTAVLHRES